MAVGMKESSKKKLVRSTWADHVERWQMKNWQRDQMSRKWMGIGSEEDQNCDGDCIESDIERVGEECKTLPIERRYWRMLTENVVKEK